MNDKKIKTYIQKNWLKMTNREMGEELGLTELAIKGRGNRMKLPRKPQNYRSGDMTKSPTEKIIQFLSIAKTKKEILKRFNTLKVLKQKIEGYQIFTQRNEYYELLYILLPEIKKEIEIKPKKFKFHIGMGTDGTPDPYVLVELPKFTGTVYIAPLFDVHLGNFAHRREKFLSYINWIASNDNVYAILGGDLMENAIDDGRGMTYDQSIPPMSQWQEMAVLLAPIAHKILCSTTGNHECLSEDTEILTKDGWKKYTEISTGNLVLTFNNEIGEWNPIDKIHIYKHKGLMVNIKSSRLDMLVTPNHRIFYKTRDGKFKFTEVSKLPDTNTRLNIPIAIKNTQEDYDIEDGYLELFGWILTDGHINKNYDNITLYQSGEKHKLITNLLDSLKIEHKVRQRNREITHIQDVKLKSVKTSFEIAINSETSRKILNTLKISKKSFPSWLNKLSQRQFDIFLNGYILGDGSIRKNCKTSKMIYMKNKEWADTLQALLLQNNYTSTITTYRENQIRINISRPLLYSQLCTSGKLSSHLSHTPYYGNVWCISVKNENFLVRRKGKVFFTGNSRTYKKTGIDVMRLLAEKLKIPYFSGPIWLSVIANGYKRNFWISHGFSNSKTKGGKMNSANQPKKFTGVIHFFVSGHVHDRVCESETLITDDPIHCRLMYLQVWTIIVQSFLSWKETYAYRSGYPPPASGGVAIELDDNGDYRGSLT